MLIWWRVLASRSCQTGFLFVFFEAGDEVHWARIETSVLEFETEQKALEYFEKKFLPHLEELKKRCIFVLNPDGLPIATANSWFEQSQFGRQATLHWVSVCPNFQNLGLGKAIVKQALHNFSKLEKNQPIWLHTQTWSHKAVVLYSDLGFKMQKNDSFAKITDPNAKVYPNDFFEAINVLKTILTPNQMQKLTDFAE